MSATFLEMQPRVLALLVCAFSVCASAANAGDASTNRVPYDAAMRCFIAAEVASGRSRDAGDTPTADAYKGKAKDAFDITVNLGHVMGFSKSQIDRDFASAQERELPRLVKDPGYFERVTQTCRQLELM